MNFTIEKFACPSWNDMMKMHCRERAKVMAWIKRQSAILAMNAKGEVKTPVEITIEAHFKKKTRRDPDNLFVKPIVDGIVAAKMIPDDNGEKVSRVVLMAKVGMEEDQVFVEIL